MEKVTAALTELLDWKPRLLAIGEQAASERPATGGWSKKEILGHLIDSAANNHQRFVRLQLEPEIALPSYAQNEWVAVQRYRDRSWVDLVELWWSYNRHLRHVVEHMDTDVLGRLWKRPSGDLTLGFIVEDYVVHMRHHLEQIL